MSVGHWNFEDGHPLVLIQPKDITGGATGARFSMANYGHASILVAIGASAAAPTKILLNACTAQSGGVSTPIPYTLYASETSLSDVAAAKEAVASTGRTPSANDNIFYGIELDARELPEDSKWVEVSITNTTNAVIAAAVAFLSAPRYGNPRSATVLT